MIPSSSPYRPRGCADRCRLRRRVAVLLALIAGAGWAQQPSIVQLHHRSAESLITVLRPLAAPAVLSGGGTQLQVRASPSDLPRVLRLVEQADRPPRSLVVAFSEEPPTEEATAAPSAAPTAGDVASDGRRDAEMPPPDRSVTLSTGRAMPSDRYGNGQIVSTQSAARSAETLEGEPLRISMPASQSLWFGVRGVQGGGAGPKAAAAASSRGASAAPDVAGVAHFDAVSDFTARIWLADGTVAIELQPLGANRIDAGTDQASDRAIVYGRVGRWIALADSGADLQSPSHVSGAARTGLWIKIDAAPDPPKSP
jgi:hypothetical protein